MDYGRLTLEEIKKGYRFDREEDAYLCNYCGNIYRQGQIFPVGDSFYVPEHAAAKHIETEHGGNIRQLLYSDTKYNTLTDNQKELMSLFYSGCTDGDIAKKLGVSASTVRRQKFTFREKAKQAKLYLAVFEGVFEDRPANDEAIIPIHDHAAYYDDRYVITEQERAHISEAFFESLEPLILKAFPVKEKKKVVVLAKIAELFEFGKKYAEKEVNQVIEPVYEDFVTIRRYLIMYGFMERTNDGSSYWLVP